MTDPTLSEEAEMRFEFKLDESQENNYKADVANGATGPKTGLKTGQKGRGRILELIRERPKITIAELIEETGAMIGIEGFTPDADGICVLASDIGEIVIMDCREDPRGLVLLNAAVTDVPPEAGAALLEALKANRGFRDTKGSTLSVDPETNRFELSRYAFLEGLDPDRFVAIIEDFATALVDVRAKIEGAQLSGDPDDVSESLGMEHFMRV